MSRIERCALAVIDTAHVTTTMQASTETGTMRCKAVSHFDSTAGMTGGGYRVKMGNK